VWELASQRANAVRKILESKSNRTAEVDKWAAKLGISDRQMWRQLRDFAQHGTTSGMVAQTAGRKRGARILDIRVERIIDKKIEKFYLVPESPTRVALWERIAGACREEGLKPPTKKTVARRLDAYRTRSAQRRRLGHKGAKYKFVPMPGHVEVHSPLERVEIDHTPLDVMARSDDPLCKYVARPWLTIAIDVYTRCVLGVHIGFEHPSILSVALCLTHAVLPKDPSDFDPSLSWPMHGVPKMIMVDNGKDFVSAAFQRGCEEYGIVLCYRPIGSPHYGGMIERLIGTMVGQCHLLPGTTKNSVKARRDYDSQKHASMTLSQLRSWFIEQVLGHYHTREHRNLRMPPMVAWQRAKEAGRDDQAA
jgi:putative transposase